MARNEVCGYAPMPDQREQTDACTTSVENLLDDVAQA